MKNQFIEKNGPIFGAIFLGIYLGIYQKAFSQNLEIISEIYLSTISFTIIPITLTLLAFSISSLMTTTTLSMSARRVWMIIIGALFVGTGIAVGTASLWIHLQHLYAAGAPLVPNLSTNSAKTIHYLSINDTLGDLNNIRFDTFIATLIPKNIFNSLATGNSLQVFVIAVMIGMALSTRTPEQRASILNSLSSIRSIFTAILQASLSVLPIGLVAIISTSLLKIEASLFLAMLPFVYWLFAAYGILAIISLIVLKCYSPLSITEMLKATREALYVSFSTGSNQAALPLLMDALEEKVGFKKDQIETIIPLFVIVCRVTSASYFAFTSVFIAAVYNIPLEPMQYLFIMFAAVLASLASSGSNSLVGFSMITLILNPLGVPLGEVGAILLILEPFIDPFRTALSMLIVTSLSCVILDKKSELKEVAA